MEVTKKQATALKQNFARYLHDVDEKADSLKAIRREFEELELYKMFQDEEGNSFNSFEDFCLAPEPFGLAKSKEEIEGLIEKRFLSEKERIKFAALNTTGEENIGSGRYASKGYEDNILEKRAEKNMVSVRQQVELDYLAREFPYKFVEVQAGIKSLNMALKEVGKREHLVQFPIDNLLKMASKIKDYLSKSQINELISNLNNSEVPRLSELTKRAKNGRKIQN